MAIENIDTQFVQSYKVIRFIQPTYNPETSSLWRTFNEDLINRQILENRPPLSSALSLNKEQFIKV